MNKRHPDHAETERSGITDVAICKKTEGKRSMSFVPVLPSPPAWESTMKKWQEELCSRELGPAPSLREQGPRVARAGGY